MPLPDCLKREMPRLMEGLMSQLDESSFGIVEVL
jgi:hypothetical protein